METLLSELIEIVKEWPVIIQGAMGSALFWLVLLLAQKFFELSSKYFSRRSKEQRISWLVSRDAKHEAFGGADDYAQSAYATSTLIYRSLRPVYRGFLWLGLGLVVYPFTDIGLAIGGIGLIYYFLKAYEVVSPLNIEENTPEEWQKVEEELVELGAITSSLDKKTNKSIQPTADASAD